MVYVYSSKFQRRLEFQESIMDALGFEDETTIRIRQDSCDLVVGADCLGFECIDIPLCVSLLYVINVLF
uniref:Nucleoside diphosphate hydrolase, putative n=1 Tax=Schistosoma mansoni TaxID=6183 RepID=A0A5K4F8A1_SCHMA